MVSSSAGPAETPAGDVGTAMLYIDSLLKRMRDGGGEPADDQRELLEAMFESFDAKAANDLIDGTCTLIHLYMLWLGQVHEAHDQDVIEYVLPHVVGTLRQMKRSVAPEAIPTMAGMMIATATDQSPTLWRKQYGRWLPAEMNALQATAFLLAEHINRCAKDDEAATRMIMELLSSAEDEGLG